MTKYAVFTQNVGDTSAIRKSIICGEKARFCGECFSAEPKIIVRSGSSMVKL